ncbi:hypothetical protein [Terasakiella pusilla]|uniref:hypothetical protein n=1 Tax=Terasakiella pusilla TaxID=64973 RepID=UPI003AA85279
MDISKFNGEFELTLASNVQDILPGCYDHGTATLTIADGSISGVDSGGITYSGNIVLKPEDPDKVYATVTVDPRTGTPSSFVMHYDGSPKREPVTHDCILKLSEIAGKVMLRGDLKVGPLEIKVSIQRV